MSKTIALNRFRFGVLVFINCPFLQNGSQDAIDGRYIVGNLGGVVERPKLADPGPTLVRRWGSPFIHPHLAKVDPKATFAGAENGHTVASSCAIHSRMYAVATHLEVIYRIRTFS